MNASLYNNLQEELEGLPGADLVLRGLIELKDRVPAEYGLLLLVAAPRLRSSGIQVPDRSDIPLPYEHQLYSLLETAYGDDAFSRYNSLIRRMASFSQAFEQRLGEAHA